MRFRLIDRVTRWEPGRAAEGFKCVPLSEDVFNDHFPRKPLLPGVLVLEGLQQLATVLIEASMLREGKPIIARLVSVDGIKFRDMVTPGDTLHHSVEVAAMTDSGAKISASARKGDVGVGSCRMVFDSVPDDAEAVEARIASNLRDWAWAAEEGEGDTQAPDEKATG